MKVNRYTSPQRRAPALRRSAAALRGWLPAFAAMLLTLPAAADPVKTVTIATTATILNGQPHYTGTNQRVIDEGWLAGQLRQREIGRAHV